MARQPTYAEAREAGGFYYLSGMTAVDETGAVRHPGDIAGQCRYIFDKVAAVLAAHGLGLDSVVQTRDYITTTEGYRETAAVRREVFGERFPAATGVVVAGLVRPEALIEIEVVAYGGDHAR